MKKAIAIVAIFISLNCFSQTTKEDSIKKVQTVFIDSISKHTSLSDFAKWLYENVSHKNENEGKWSELFNLFLQTEYSKFAQKPKKP